MCNKKYAYARYGVSHNSKVAEIVKGWTIARDENRIRQLAERIENRITTYVFINLFSIFNFPFSILFRLPPPTKKRDGNFDPFDFTLHLYSIRGRGSRSIKSVSPLQPFNAVH